MLFFSEINRSTWVPEFHATLPASIRAISIYLLLISNRPDTHLYRLPLELQFACFNEFIEDLAYLYQNILELSSTQSAKAYSIFFKNHRRGEYFQPLLDSLYSKLFNESHLKIYPLIDSIFACYFENINKKHQNNLLIDSKQSLGRTTTLLASLFNQTKYLYKDNGVDSLRLLEISTYLACLFNYADLVEIILKEMRSISIFYRADLLLFTMNLKNNEVAYVLLKDISIHKKLKVGDDAECSLLYHAVKMNNLNLTRKLLELGANPDLGYVGNDGSKHTPLQVALEEGLSEIENVLTEYTCKKI